MRGAYATARERTSVRRDTISSTWGGANNPSGPCGVMSVKRDLIPVQQQPVFIQKRHLLVMLRLIADVGHHRIRIGLADGKCAVA